jgi:hypothetical protein
MKQVYAQKEYKKCAPIKEHRKKKIKKVEHDPPPK